MATEYDLVIVGGGTGGYVAAIRASQLGLKTAIVETAKVGGTCLHKGCIPSKALLRSAEVYSTILKSAEYGIIAEHITYNFGKVQERKQKIVDQLHHGVQALLKKAKVDIYEGFGRLLGASIFSPMAGTISVTNSGGEDRLLLPKHVLLATGSRPKSLSGLEVDGHYILSSDEALELEELPESIIIVGGGVIGVEWASLFSDFGLEVTIIEQATRLLPTEDVEISKEMTRLLKRKKVEIVTGAELLVDQVNMENNEITIHVRMDESVEIYRAQKVLVSVGRVPNSEQIGLENTTIQTVNSAIKVNEVYQTHEAHIYAIGDVIGGLQLAHVAAHEGIIAVEHMAGLNPEPLAYEKIATCIYSKPEIARVGLTEEEAKKKGYQVRVGTFPFKAIGKALVFGEQDGFVKIIMDEKSQDLLGVHMIGPQVTEMISEAALAMILDATPWEIAQAIHPHPSLAEAIGEAALAVEGKPIHM